jgi:large subunit ribosomal protein L24
MKIKVGDTVVVIAGKNRFAKAKGDDKAGNTGKVIRVLPKAGRVVIEGINKVKRHMRKRGDQAGQIVEFEAPIHISNVMIIDPKSKKRSRIGYKADPKGKKQRISKNSKTAL